MSDERPPDPSGRTEPWWERPGDPGAAPPDDPRPPSADPPVSWFERREPILQAVAARVDPLERSVGHVAAELESARTEIAAFAAETRDALKVLLEALEATRSESSSASTSLEGAVAGVAGQTAELTQALAAEATDTRETLLRALAEGNQAIAAGTAESRDALARAIAAAADISERRLHQAMETLTGAIERIEADVATTARTETLEEAGQRLAAAIEGLRAESLTAIQGSSGNAVAATEAARTELAGAVEGARRELAGAVEAGRADSSGWAEAHRAELETSLAAVRARVDEVDANMHQALREAAIDVGLALREAATSVESSINEASRIMRADQAASMDAYAVRFADVVRPIEDGLDRVERLAAVIEAMGKRRGFQELVSSERALREEQAGFVETLSSAGTEVSSRVTGLTERIERLEARMERAAEDAAAMNQLPARASEGVAAAVERLRVDLSGSLQERFGEQVGQSVAQLRAELEAGLPVKDALQRLRDLATTHAQVARTQESVDALIGALRLDLRALRERIQSWGKPRTAPRLAHDLDGLGERLDALEEDVRGALADRVAERVTAEVTAQVLAALQESEAERRRGRFRR